MIVPELLRPQQFSALLVEALQPARHACRKQSVAGDQRRGVRPVPHLARGVALERHRRRVFPERLPRFRIGRHHHFLPRLAVHHVEHAVLDRRRRIALAKRSLPHDARTGRGPRVFQSTRVCVEIAIRAAPLRPGERRRFRGRLRKRLGRVNEWCGDGRRQECASIHLSIPLSVFLFRYSYLSATSGSTRDARRAGMYAASSTEHHHDSGCCGQRYEIHRDSDRTAGSPPRATPSARAECRARRRPSSR